MDGLSLVAAIGVGALLVLVIFLMPFAARHDWVASRRRERADDGADGAVAVSVAIFGGDGGASCSSDGGGGSC